MIIGVTALMNVKRTTKNSYIYMVVLFGIA